MAVLPPETIKWLALLVAALLLTSFGTTFPNRLNQLRSPRAHNGVRLLNECLARSQLAMFNYFLALAITSGLPHHLTAKVLLIPIVVLAAYFYVANIGASVELDVALRNSHNCAGTPTLLTSGEARTATTRPCSHRIGAAEFLAISLRYILSAAVLGGLAVYFAFLAA